MTTITPELHPIPVKSAWYYIGIDFGGPVTTSAMKNCYILTVSDYFSKWLEAMALPGKCASGIASALFKVSLFHPYCGVSSYGKEKTLIHSYLRYSCKWESLN